MTTLTITAPREKPLAFLTEICAQVADKSEHPSMGESRIQAERLAYQAYVESLPADSAMVELIKNFERFQNISVQSHHDADDMRDAYDDAISYAVSLFDDLIGQMTSEMNSQCSEDR